MPFYNLVDVLLKLMSKFRVVVPFEVEADTADDASASVVSALAHADEEDGVSFELESIVDTVDEIEDDVEEEDESVEEEEDDKDEEGEEEEEKDDEDDGSLD